MKLAKPNRYKRIINILTKEKVIALYRDRECRAERIRISALMKFIEDEELASSFNGKKAVTHYADENGVSAGRVYRAIKRQALD